METLIVLYPSLAISVNRDSVDELLRTLAGKTAVEAGVLDSAERTDTAGGYGDPESLPSGRED